MKSMFDREKLKIRIFRFFERINNIHLKVMKKKKI